MPLNTTCLKAVFTLDELKELFAFTLDESKTKSFSINTDSRTIKQNEIFLPLTGENFDGHDFINNTLEICSLAFCEKSKTPKVKKENKSKLLLVENALDAYHKIANHYRKKINPKVIAITGSSGKTTVKDLISSVLSIKYKVHKTEANFNNEIGVPKTILEMPEGTQVLVLELAMRGKGEIGFLSKTAEPDIAVITNVGTAHIGRLGTRENIAKAKCEALMYLRKEGIAVLHNDTLLKEEAKKLWRGKTILFGPNESKDVSFEGGRSNFSFHDRKYSIPTLGRIHVLNSIVGILVAETLGLKKEEIDKGLNSFNVPEGRGEIVKLKGDVYLIDETYNANPDSVKAAVSNLLECWGNDFKKVLVLGELAELGDCQDNLLKELAIWLQSKYLDNIITVGNKLSEINFAQNAKDNKECCAILKNLIMPKTIFLLKGSHAAKLDEVVKNLINHGQA